MSFSASVLNFPWGPSTVHDLLSLSKQGVGTVTPWLPTEITDKLLADVEPYIQVSGLFGNPEEIEKSGLAEETDLRDGKKFYQIVVGLFELSANISPSRLLLRRMYAGRVTTGSNTASHI
jgi:hypothetical protein